MVLAGDEKREALAFEPEGGQALQPEAVVYRTYHFFESSRQTPPHLCRGRIGALRQLGGGTSRGWRLGEIGARLGQRGGKLGPDRKISVRGGLTLRERAPGR